MTSLSSDGRLLRSSTTNPSSPPFGITAQPRHSRWPPRVCAPSPTLPTQKCNGTADFITNRRFLGRRREMLALVLRFSYQDLVEQSPPKFHYLI
ncbi:hypothetical protein MTP99_017831 [Tenebrio molitor]|nr:hypothetical protein MTP99_017831 [Tenebrio molitor]